MPRIAPTAILVLLCSTCAPPAEQGGFDSPNPAAKMYAIEHAMAAGDRSATPHIVEELDSDDPAVRMLAIGALRRLWNEDYGYHYDDPMPDRNAAILRWLEAINSGQLGEFPAQARVNDG